MTSDYCPVDGPQCAVRELLVGIEGLALLRHLYDGTDVEADRRLAEVRRILDDEAFAAGELTTEADPVTAYRAWSETYDEPGNPIIAIEEPIVWALVAGIPPGSALDAACGTGRPLANSSGSGTKCSVSICHRRC